MKFPPSIVAMRIVEEGRTRFRIWLPLFVLWPLLLVFLVLALVVCVAVDLARLPAGRKHAYSRLVWGGVAVVGETRGTEIFVESADRTVVMTLR